jgi:uncharacterized protein YnzC (UPF0291/DUF896 family)
LITTHSQEPSRFFLRKSISYYDGILLPNSVSVPSTALNLIKTKLKQALFLARYDYNNLPPALQTKADIAIAGLNNPTPERLGKALEDVLVPEIVKILSINRALRTKEFVDQQERINFLTTKAKESGITADDLEKVMNAGYLFIPYITYYKRSVQNSRIDIDIEGGIVWYHISVTSDPPQLIPLVKKSSNAYGTAIIGKKYHEFIWGGEELSAEEFANLNAVQAYVKNLQTLTREIPEFRLSAEIITANNGNITFELGTKEGLKLDDKLDIIEFFEDASGIPRPKSIGCALVTKVVNNKATTKTISYSEARSFIGKAEPGMLVSERARLPINLGLRFVSFPLKHNDNSIQTFGGELGLDFNISSLFQLPHFYLPFALGYANPEDQDNYFEISLGLLKKFYLPRFAFGPLIKGKFIGINSSFQWPGAEFSGIGEFYITPDFSLSIKGGYCLAALKDNLKPEGIIWSAGLNYNPPTLPFDPLGFLRGISGI